MSDPATRLYVPDLLGPRKTILLDPDRAHFLRHVLRLEDGDTVALFNGRDGEWAGTVHFQGKNSVTVTLQNQIRVQNTLPEIRLLFAPVKKDRMDFIIEKATELGVTHLQPVLTERTQVGRVNTDRLRSQAIEAAEQCERLSVPVVQEPEDLAALLSRWPAGQTLFLCAEAGESVPLAKAFGEAPQGPATFLVGPEGGFSPQELALLRNQPFVMPVHLGPRILRAETAVAAILSCWQAIRGDWQSAPRQNIRNI
ncbi:MAG: 16S rRNA (uracil(1498)-N(3))-methyltransferase [Pseudomonadota bacterium]|nr:16S rRNA (uracil(1498)-N(3))-methyltransferase [Pseudomonadota bacterium]